MKVDPVSARLNRSAGGVETLHLSDAGGLTQFGFYLETLPPGAFSSNRHWHSAEDEALFVLSGSATLIDDDGAHVMAPGDAAVWRRGDGNAHHLHNGGDQPCRYLIIGARVAGDICSYPDLGHRQVNAEADWRVEDAAGTVLRGGVLPPELLDLAPDWGAPIDASLQPLRVQREAGREWRAEAPWQHAILGGGLGPFRYANLGDPGGLTQFGLYLETLPPGSRSSFRHWHEAEDEMVYLLSGELVLIEEDESTLHPGDAACWAAGRPTAHCLENRGTQDACHLIVGTRKRTDTIHYPDHDLITHKDGPARSYLHRDGTPRSKGEST